MTLESVDISGLDPRALEVAVRASDAGQVTDDNKLKQIVAAVLAAGNLSVATAQVPFNIRDGRLAHRRDQPRCRQRPRHHFRRL